MVCIVVRCCNKRDTAMPIRDLWQFVQLFGLVSLGHVVSSPAISTSGTHTVFLVFGEFLGCHIDGSGKQILSKGANTLTPILKLLSLSVMEEVNRL